MASRSGAGSGRCCLPGAGRRVRGAPRGAGRLLLAGAVLALGGCGWFAPRASAPEVLVETGTELRPAVAPGTDPPRPLSGYEVEVVSLRAVAPPEPMALPMVEPLTPAPGQALYAEYCTVCHGGTGQGDGALGAALPVRPADLTALAALNGGAYPAGRVLAAVHGTPGPYHRGTLPGFDALLGGAVREWVAPDGSVLLAPKGLVDLVAYVGSLQAP